MAARQRLLKVWYGDDCRRITATWASFADLVQHLSELFGLSDPLALTYTDPEGDTCKVCSDEELTEAFRMTPVTAALRVVVAAQPEENADADELGLPHVPKHARSVAFAREVTVVERQPLQGGEVEVDVAVTANSAQHHVAFAPDVTVLQPQPLHDDDGEEEDANGDADADANAGAADDREASSCVSSPAEAAKVTVSQAELNEMVARAMEHAAEQKKEKQRQLREDRRRERQEQRTARREEKAKLALQEASSAPTQPLEHNSNCTHCKAPIVGSRFLCVGGCDGFELCGHCEASGVHPAHPLIRLRVPGTVPKRLTWQRVRKLIEAQATSLNGPTTTDATATATAAATELLVRRVQLQSEGSGFGMTIASSSVGEWSNVGQASVGHVRPGSAAEAAGLRPDDVFVAIDGKPVHSSPSYESIVKLIRAKPVHECWVCRPQHFMQAVRQFETQQQLQQRLEQLQQPPEQTQAEQEQEQWEEAQEAPAPNANNDDVDDIPDLEETEPEHDQAEAQEAEAMAEAPAAAASSSRWPLHVALLRDEMGFSHVGVNDLEQLLDRFDGDCCRVVAELVAA